MENVALQPLFEQLGISENAYRIYVYLMENGATGARALGANLDIPRPSVYDYLDILIQKGLVTERFETNKRLFQVDDVRNISHLLVQQIQLLQKTKNGFEEMLPHLLKQDNSVEPKIRFYSGVEGVRQVLNDMMLWHHDIDTWALWPIADMLQILGKEYHEEFTRRRIKQRLHVYGLWPQDKRVSLRENTFLGVGKEFFRDVRVAPKGMTWSMGYWIYADKVAFVSSRKETFGFVIHSKDFAETQKAQFRAIWDISKPVSPNAAHTKSFLETV